MPEFPHLPLPRKISATHKPKRLSIERVISDNTRNNLSNRRQHGRGLLRNVNQLSTFWEDQLNERQGEGLPELPNPELIPIFLQVDSDLFDAEQLYSFGIEVIAEDEDGFIIGASSDNFRSLKEKITKFIREEGKFKDKAAQLWQIIIGNQWRIDYILSDDLKSKWGEIEDDEVLIVDASIACYLKKSNAPPRKRNETARQYTRRYNRWLEKKEGTDAERDELELSRQTELEDFIQELEGEIISGFVSYDDSFSCRIKLSGKALKDFVLNYQYLFDVTEYDDLTYAHPETGEEEVIEVDFYSPPDHAATVCIIDSGIQEGHRMITDAIDEDSSRSYLTADDSVVDNVPGGGHGTKVAGAILFGNEIPKEGDFQHILWIQNARVLSDTGWLPEDLFPPEIMNQIAEDYNETKVFNLSINSNRSCKTVHMSEWAAAIDSISHEQDKLFIISAGNINQTNLLPNNPGIREHLQAGRNYPNYLLRNASRIANPGQSCFSLTVGSVGRIKYEDEDRESFAGQDEPSSFTRTGPGIWNMVKPDVVEYGGDYVKERTPNPLITVETSSAIEVVKSTVDGANALGYDIGTSFAAPKVSHIAGQVLNEIPLASANLIRALIVQSARHPDGIFRNPSLNNIRTYGYGIPDRLRATQNHERRITLTAESNIAAKQAEIYTIRIPDEMRGVADEYDILIEVTLAFTARPRRTRRKTKSYLSTWVDWQSSKLDETFNHFRSRVSEYTEGDEPVEKQEEDGGSIQWQIRENPNWGSVKGLRRQDSSLQKDWVIMKPYNIPEEFSLAVVGHQGWEKDIRSEVPYALAVSFEVLGAEIDVYNLIAIENEIEVQQEINTGT